MRKIIFGSYDTHLNGPWTLTGWELTPAEHRKQFVEVPGRDGELDLSTALTDGAPRYGNRTLTATFERSDGTRLEREAAINTMVNWLDGWRMDIRLPDDELHYITGRVHVEKNYNDPAHAAVTVTAVCDPWRYNNYETVLSMTASATPVATRLPNEGRRTVVPTLNITGTGASVSLVYGTYSWVLGPGVYQLPDLIVPQGGIAITYSGTGNLSFTYRDAVL
jgi:hypothetical protein